MATSPDVAANAASFEPIRTGAQYIDSMRGRNMKVYLFGELVGEPVDHPMIRPSIKRRRRDLRPGDSKSGARHGDVAVDR